MSSDDFFNVLSFIIWAVKSDSPVFLLSSSNEPPLILSLIYTFGTLLVWENIVLRPFSKLSLWNSGILGVFGVVASGWVCLQHASNSLLDLL